MTSINGPWLPNLKPPPSHHPLGLAYRQGGDLEEAKTHLARAGITPVLFQDPLMDELRRFVSGVRAYLLAGYQAIQEGDFKRALEVYRKTVDIDPQNAMLHGTLGALLAQLKLDDEAMVSLRKAIELDPDHQEAHFNLAAVLSRAGHLEEALHHFDQVLAIDSEDLEARLHKAMALKALEQVPQAIAELETILAVDPTHSVAQAQLTALFLKQEGF